MASYLENKIITDHILFGIDTEHRLDSEQLDELKQHFCGIAISDIDVFKHQLNNNMVYLYGNICHMFDIIPNLNNSNVYIIDTLSYNADVLAPKVTLGQVPINVHGQGVFFRQLFDDPCNYFFDRLNEAHTFLDLTESNKEGVSYRRGLYISEIIDDGSSLTYHLLRCSTNLKGPTENTRDVDEDILYKLQYIHRFFTHPAPLNHVLAQIYTNNVVNNRPKKATIKQHSDKTKDMDSNGLIVFCTFYNFSDTLKYRREGYDYFYKKTSVLTRLRFRLKSCVHNDDLIKQFDVILYPNSVFAIPLSTNRLYTHEIVPSGLPVEHLPTRLGYVVRSSNVKAIYKDGQTYVVDSDDLVQLKPQTPELAAQLKHLYFLENSTTDVIDYSSLITEFSLNDGDYMAPEV